MRSERTSACGQQRQRHQRRSAQEQAGQPMEGSSQHAPIRLATTLLPVSHAILLSSILPTTRTSLPGSTTVRSLCRSARASSCPYLRLASSRRGEGAREVVGRGRSTGGSREEPPVEVEQVARPERVVRVGQTTSRTAVPSSTVRGREQAVSTGCVGTTQSMRKDTSWKAHPHRPMRPPFLSTRARRSSPSTRPGDTETPSRGDSILSRPPRRGARGAGTRGPRRRGAGQRSRSTLLREKHRRQRVRAAAPRDAGAGRPPILSRQASWPNSAHPPWPRPALSPSPSY